jgi:hypothetical protein
MIAKVINHKTSVDSYKIISNYINDAKNKNSGKSSGEKVLMSWHEGCLTDEYDVAVREVEATQAMNVRSRREKTFHLVVSFRPEDEAVLTPELYKEIEKNIAEALGFEGHQRHCGVHQNTNNLHMHIAYNMINSNNYRRHDPFYGYQKLAKVCRILEEKYGLAADHRLKSADESEIKISEKAKTVESYTIQESFHRYVLSQKQYIADNLAVSKNWPEFQTHLARIGIEAELRGRGLVFKEINGKLAIKGSDAGRELSFSKLTQKLGPYKENYQADPTEIGSYGQYGAKPLNLGVEKSPLYEEFLGRMTYRKEALAKMKAAEGEAYRLNRSKWAEKIKATGKYAMTWQHRQQLLAKAKAMEEAELIQNRKTLAEERKKIRTEIPYTSWAAFLRFKAVNGDETALGILRSKDKDFVPEEIKVSTDYEDRRVRELKIAESANQKKEAISEACGINSKDRKSLVSVVKMQEVIEKEGERSSKTIELTFKIDNEGTIIYYLKDINGTIRDTGSKLYFSNNEECKDIAKKYAISKWGKIELSGSSFGPRKAVNTKSKSNVPGQQLIEAYISG